MTPPDATRVAYPYPTQSTDMLDTCQEHNMFSKVTHQQAPTSSNYSQRHMYHEKVCLSRSKRSRYKIAEQKAAAQTC